MRAALDGRARVVTLTMSLGEFREHVEWLELLSPHDGCTHDWRAALDHIDPPDDEDD